MDKKIERRKLKEKDININNKRVIFLGNILLNFTIQKKIPIAM